jgi:dipeptidyl aminopeptidase/acylaminoacyl peptidase
LVCTYEEKAVARLAVIDTGSLKARPLDLPFTDIDAVTAAGGQVIFLAGAPDQPQALYSYDLHSHRLVMLRASREVTFDPGYISTPEKIEFPTENGLTAFGNYFPPANPEHTAPEGEKPPLIVMSHGGPTARASQAFRLDIQYFTSRGLAVLDVDYGGSSGYGRDYRRRLNGNWGVVDVEDCANGAIYLVERGDVDPDRIAITGGSAGGYTTLCALTFHDVFKAGASHYGIGDLETLAQDTHKFESRYLDSLIGPWPDRKDLYRMRSPINFTDRLTCSLILFQGLEDKVVPPSQSEAMYRSVLEKGLPVAYLPFEGEQHGFRKAENIKRSLEAELYFYSQVFGFELAEFVEPVEIKNLRV